jgi:tetratricopeptide (TPR) repeat protein
MQPSELASRIPHRLDVSFIGRDEFMDNLRRLLDSEGSGGKVHVLQGPSGIGKTRIAAEYAHRYATQYEFIGWIGAEQTLNLGLEFASFAVELQLPERKTLDVKLMVNGVKSWLSKHSPWLLIFDDAESIRRIRSFLPSKCSGHVLVTSRKDFSDAAQPVIVSPLSFEESLNLLLYNSDVEPDDQTVALVDALKLLPLPLCLARSYLQETRQTPSQYLAALTNLVSTPSALYGNDNAELSTASVLSARRLQGLSPAGADLLGLCAFFSADKIPLTLIQQAMPHLPDALAEAAASPVLFEKVVVLLERLSLAERVSDTLSMHTNVQSAVRSQLAVHDKRTYAEIAVLIMRDAIKFEDGKSEKGFSNLDLVPHALVAAKHAKKTKVAYEAVTSLLNQIGMYLEIRGDLKEAERANKQALRVGQLVYGANHPGLSAIYKNLGDISRKLKDPAKAKDNYDQALTIAEAAYSSENPVIATLASNIGEVLHETGRKEEAQEYFQRALTIDETAYGNDHPNLVQRLKKVASVHEELGDLVKAHASYDRLVQILESTAGTDSDEVTTARAILSRLVERLESVAINRARYEKSMEVTEQFLTEAGATVHRETERVFRVHNLRGRFKSFAPLPVLVTTTNPIRQDVVELFQHSRRFSKTNAKHAGIFVYHEQPDVFVQMQIAELRVRDGFVIIPIPLAALEQALLDSRTCSGILAHYCQHYLPGVDLFDDRNAIGDTLSFFGRSELLHMIEGDLVQAQAIGIFGLRKSGKTSVLLQLGLGMRKHPVLHIDLQPYGGNPRFGVELFHEVVRRLSSMLGDRRRSGNHEFIKPRDSYASAAEMSLDFMEAVSALSGELEGASYESPILILLDEVERILPTANDPRQKVEEFNAFFGALRALSQQQRKIGLLIADVHPDCNRINHWEQQGLPTNPVNQFFKELFLRPFSEEETTSMLVNIGRLMGRSFDEETLKGIHKQSGGHPFVARQLASLLTSKLPGKMSSTIKWPQVIDYVMRPFVYSGVLKDYFEQNIWEDIRIRSLHSSMAVLRTLACKEHNEDYTTEQDLFRLLGDHEGSQLMDTMLWLESVGLLECKEAKAGERQYRMKLPLLSLFIQMQMTEKEIRQWQI